MKRLLLLASCFGLLAAVSAKAQSVPTFVSQTNVVGDADPHADTTVTLGAHATNDILYLSIMVRDVDDSITIDTATGWAQVTGSPFDRGTTARYWIWWKRAASAAETNPVINYSTTTADSYYNQLIYRGAITTETPHEVLGSAQTGTADPTSLTGITSLTANSLIVIALFGEDNNNGPPGAGCTATGTDPAAYTEHYDESGTGADAVACWSEFERVTAGATGTVSIDWDTAVPVGWGAILMALKPVPAPAGRLRSVVFE